MTETLIESLQREIHRLEGENHRLKKENAALENIIEGEMARISANVAALSAMADNAASENDRMEKILAAVVNAQEAGR